MAYRSGTMQRQPGMESRGLPLPLKHPALGDLVVSRPSPRILGCVISAVTGAFKPPPFVQVRPQKMEPGRAARRGYGMPIPL